MRIASLVVCEPRRFQSEIVVMLGSTQANARNVLDLMCLAAERGSEVEIEASGPDADAAVAALTAFLSAGDPSQADSVFSGDAHAASVA
jgi:phosphotransferase system HPr (HPr) family protein